MYRENKAKMLDDDFFELDEDLLNATDFSKKIDEAGTFLDLYHRKYIWYFMNCCCFCFQWTLMKRLAKIYDIWIVRVKIM